MSNRGVTESVVDQATLDRGLHPLLSPDPPYLYGLVGEGFPTPTATGSPTVLKPTRARRRSVTGSITTSMV